MRCTISQLYFGKELYMFRTDLLSIIRSLNTVFTAMGICYTSYVDCLLARCISLVFIIRIYHDARPSECQILNNREKFGSVCDGLKIIVVTGYDVI